MTSVTAREIFCYCPFIYMPEASFAWLNAKCEKNNNCRFFCTTLYNCKNSDVYMVKAYDLVVFTCIINGSFDNAMGMLDVGMSVRRS